MNLSTTEKLSVIAKEAILKFLTLNYFVIRRVINNELTVKKTEKLLDLGCGTGMLASLFPPSSYYGIDTDEKLIAFAKETYPLYKFAVMSGAGLQFKQNTFDKVLIVGVIHHLDAKTNKKTCEGLKKIVKKGGVIVAIEAIPPIHKQNLIGKYLRAHDEGHHIVTMDAYKKALSPFFTIEKAYQQAGGLFDYGVFVLRT